MHRILKLHAWVMYFWVLLLVSKQLLFKIYCMYLVFQLTYSQFLVLLNKPMVSILITFNLEVVDVNNLQIVVSGKKEAGSYHLNSFTSPLPSSNSLIYNFFVDVMPWWLKKILNCGMLALVQL